MREVFKLNRHMFEFGFLVGQPKTVNVDFRVPGDYKGIKRSCTDGLTNLGITWPGWWNIPGARW